MSAPPKTYQQHSSRVGTATSTFATQPILDWRTTVHCTVSWRDCSKLLQVDVEREDVLCRHIVLETITIVCVSFWPLTLFSTLQVFEVIALI